MSLSAESAKRFDALHAAGMLAKQSGNQTAAIVDFYLADELAKAENDERKRLDALNPLARAFWSLDYFDEAASRLKLAARIAKELDLTDERAMAFSNMGRLAAVQTIKLEPVRKQAKELRAQSLPFFQLAYESLLGHDHLYYRFANATHGGVVTALAGVRSIARELIEEGYAVANEISPEPYDQKTPAQISPGGLKQLKAARYLIPLGNRTPFLAKKARAELIR